MDLPLPQFLPRPALPPPPEEIGTALAFFYLEEEAGQFWRQGNANLQQFVPWAAVPFRDEDPSTPLRYFYDEQEEPAQAASAAQAVPWLARSFPDEDPSTPLTFFYSGTCGYGSTFAYSGG